MTRAFSAQTKSSAADHNGERTLILHSSRIATSDCIKQEYTIDIQDGCTYYHLKKYTKSVHIHQAHLQHQEADSGLKTMRL